MKHKNRNKDCNKYNEEIVNCVRNTIITNDLYIYNFFLQHKYIGWW
jgi:hypothetical protein